MVLSIMRDSLGLRFNQCQLGRDRFTDALFDTKRVVVSRLLA
jgi:hypothetical protein